MQNGSEPHFDFGNVEDWHTDPAIVANGAPFDAGKGRTLYVKRAGGANRKLLTAIAGIDPNNDAAFREVYARLVVTGWAGIVDRAGEPMPYSTDACIALFAHCPELFFDVLLFANNRANYRAKAHEEDQQAVKPQSGGSEAQAPTSTN